MKAGHPFKGWVSRALVAIVVTVLGGSSVAQCPVVVSTFPYDEGFEAQPAWTSGGTDNDWAWGMPNKQIIDAAGGGDRCWIIGGLAGNFYNYGEQSWLASPCFDLSAVQYPWISFKIFWECEKQYDGLALQYSLDEGSTWQNVGEAAGPEDCLTTNWYNTPYVNNLTLANPRHGWSGRIGASQGSCAGGDGSGGWVTASHCLDFLAGAPSVKFRFVFGAGTTCNNYDGVAIDDVHIGEAPIHQAAFTYACPNDQVQFTSTSGDCPQYFEWNFDDPASGEANTSTLQSPVHIFDLPGTYDVSLTVQGACNASSTTVVPISVLGVEILDVQPGCSGNNGSLTAVVTGANGPVDILWSPGGQTTAHIDGLGAGIYTVQVSMPGSCPVQATATLEPPTNVMQLTTEATHVSCHGANDGAIDVQTGGGTEPIAYVWTPALPDQPLVTGLAAGNYELTVTDAEGCSANAEITITEPDPLLVTNVGDTVLCAGAGLLLQPEILGGVAPYTMQYTPAGPSIFPAEATDVTITATDANGCVAQVMLTVGVAHPERPVLSTSDTLGCVPLCVTLEATGPPGAEYDWDLGDGSIATGATVETCYQMSGTYVPTLLLTDEYGCLVVVPLDQPIIAQSSPEAEFMAEPPITTIGDPQVHFIATGTGASIWFWTISGTHVYEGAALAHTFDQVDCHTVELTAMNEVGCMHQVEGIYCVEEDFALYAPNAFTPDGDGTNDVFQVITTVRQPAWFELVVMDRWGGVVFTTNDHGQGWDGSIAGPYPQGIYLWRLAMHDVAGHLREASGHVTLLR